MDVDIQLKLLSHSWEAHCLKYWRIINQIILIGVDVVEQNIYIYNPS